jgi:hypothetical protein
MNYQEDNLIPFEWISLEKSPCYFIANIPATCMVESSRELRWRENVSISKFIWYNMCQRVFYQREETKSILDGDLFALLFLLFLLSTRRRMNFVFWWFRLDPLYFERFSRFLKTFHPVQVWLKDRWNNHLAIGLLVRLQQSDQCPSYQSISGKRKEIHIIHKINHT